MSNLPVPETLLPFLEELLGVYFAALPRDTPIAVEQIALQGDTVALTLRAPRLAGLTAGRYRLELVIRESTPQCTVCTPRWGNPDGVARLAGLGAKLIPRALLNEVLERLFGGGLTVRGEDVVIDHVSLLRRLGETR